MYVRLTAKLLRLEPVSLETGDAASDGLDMLNIRTI